MRIIFTSIAFLLAALSVTPSFAYGDKKHKDKKAEYSSEQTFDEKDFTRIAITGVYELTVLSGEDYFVGLSGKTTSLQQATVRVSGNTLYLGQEKKRGFRGRKTVRARITLPSLEAISISGVVEGSVAGVDADEFRINVSGVGDLKVDGKCTHLRAELSGVGDLNARSLECNSVDIAVSGVGDARVYASEELDAHVSGIGDLTCYGSPKRISKNKNFFSSISVH